MHIKQMCILLTLSVATTVIGKIIPQSLNGNNINLNKLEYQKNMPNSIYNNLNNDSGHINVNINVNREYFLDPPKGVSSGKMNPGKWMAEIKNTSQSSGNGVSSGKMNPGKWMAEIKNTSQLSDNGVSSGKMNPGKWMAEIKNTSQSFDYDWKTSLIVSGSFHLDGGFWGTWGPIEECSFPHFVTDIELKIEDPIGAYDDTALNAIRLTCSDGGHITSSQGPWGTWKGSWGCSKSTYRSYINGAQIRREARQGRGDDTAANGVRAMCTNSDVLSRPGDGYWGTWMPFQTCESGSAIVGIQTQVERNQGWKGDDTALNDVKFFCARI